MREAGDGLQAQMNSMMGVLHELKLLQVQTALEQLQISCKPGHLFQHSLNEHVRLRNGTIHSGSMPSIQGAGTKRSQPPRKPLHICPSIDSDFSHCDTDDSSDWTSSLMNHSRNRQPLVLGDNVLADLVGNWLNLPEVEGRMAGSEEKAGRFPEVSGSPLHLSCSGEFCRRLSLTASVFKRVLRSVRPNWDKLLKERPGWQGTEQEKKEIFKRPQTKNKGSKPKRSFYRPFWMRADGLRGKRRPKPANVELRGAKGPIFDYSFAIWV
uniref:PAK4-inhibitor INKA2 n=1 Tax=Electrophorus electricus TaxID=8005 RepID=A0A4W4DXG9_ELEEL